MPSTVYVNSVKRLETLREEGLLLLLPIDTNGQVLHPYNNRSVKTLEAWEYQPSKPRERQPSICEPKNVGDLIFALLKHPEQEVLVSLYANVLQLTGKELQEWSICLHRVPSKDMYDFQLEFVQGSNPKAGGDSDGKEDLH